MSLTGLVHETDVAGLGVDDLRRVLNKLLSVEASIHRVPIADLHLTLREYDSDGGIDARVIWPASAQHDVLFPGENVFQYKTGKIGEAGIRSEFNKCGVQDSLKKGGHYHLLIGQDYNPPKLTKLQKCLAVLCKKKRIPKTRCQILGAGQIARWICRHPAVITVRELGKGLPGFWTVESWAQGPALRNPWKPDAQRADVQSRVKALLEQADLEDSVIRIEGPTGVGKTRLALECINSAGMAGRTIYAPNSDDQPVGQFLTVLSSDPEAHAVIVADECDRDRQGIFRSYVDLSQGRLRLICVGPGDCLFQSPAEFSHVFAISPMSDSDMREVLSAEVVKAPAEVTEIAVHLAGGYPKLAFFVARAVLRDTTLTPNEIRGTWDIRGFLKKFLSSETNDALGALSLFERLGWEEDLQGEAKAVAKYLRISIVDFRKGVKTLRDQGVVVPRGRYLYVTPELLAIAAAASLWDVRGAELVGIIEKLPDVRPRREFLKRLAAMGRHPEVRRVVEKLLGDDGLFRSLGDLDDEFRSQAYRILASALPDAALKVLTRLIEPASRNTLLDFKVGRRNVIWAIETLLRWPATSLLAARSLRALALADNERIANNAAGVFVEYFHIYLSRSPIPFVERLHLVDELISAGDEASRMLATRASAAGLSSHESRFGGNVDELAKRPYPPEWRPLTYADLWGARRAALLRLEQLAKGVDAAAQEAKKDQIACTFTLMNEGMFDDLIATLKSVRPDTDQERRAILDTCLRVEKDFGSHLSRDQREDLAQLRTSIFDTTYFGRLRRWVGQRLHADYGGGVEDALRRADEIAVTLAEEGVARGISDEEVAWLASREAENAWVIGRRLGELDGTLQFFERIVAFSSDDVNTVFLASYLAGRETAGGKELRERLVDQLSVDHPLMAFGCIWRGDASEWGLRRIINLVESGRVQPEALGMLVYGAWTKTLPADDVAALIRLLLKGDKAVALEPSMAMIEELLQRLPEAIDGVESLVWEILESTPPNASVMSEWRWGQLAPKVALRNPQRMTHLIVDQYSSAEYISASNERHHALQIATQADPVGAWHIVSDAILPLRNSYNLLAAVRGWYGELIPVDHMVSWAKAHQPGGPRIAARLISPSRGQLSQRARALILAFPGNEDILAELWGGVVAGFFAGPISGKMERDLAVMKQWEGDVDPVIRSQIRKYIEGMEKNLRAQRIREEEG